MVFVSLAWPHPPTCFRERERASNALRVIWHVNAHTCIHDMHSTRVYDVHMHYGLCF